METSGSPPNLTSSSVDIVPDGVTNPTLESTSDMGTVSPTTAVEEESTCTYGMDIESKSDSNLENGGVDEDERLVSENGDSSEGMDQMVMGVADMETGDNSNKEGALCADLGEQKESIKTNAETNDHLDLPTCDLDKKPGETRKTRQQPTLLTMFAANNAAQQLKQQKSLGEDSTTKIAPSTSTPLPTPAPSLTALDEFLLENNDKMTVDVPVIPVKLLTPMERFQQRLMKHMSASSSQPVRSSREKTSTGTGEEEGESSLVPEDVITKLKDKPGGFMNDSYRHKYDGLSFFTLGAVREHWRSAIRQKLSKSRAEERKALEEKRRWYNEEVGGETDEEEAELTGMSFDNVLKHILHTHVHNVHGIVRNALILCKMMKECLYLRW